MTFKTGTHGSDPLGEAKGPYEGAHRHLQSITNSQPEAGTCGHNAVALHISHAVSLILSKPSQDLNFGVSASYGLDFGILVEPHVLDPRGGTESHIISQRDASPSHPPARGLLASWRLVNIDGCTSFEIRHALAVTWAPF